MYFDRILFSAVFATLFATAALAVAERPVAAEATVAAEPQQLQSLERVVVIGKKEDARI